MAKKKSVTKKAKTRTTAKGPSKSTRASASKKTTTKKTATKKTASKKVAPKKTVSKKTVTKKTAPKKQPSAGKKTTKKKTSAAANRDSAAAKKTTSSRTATKKVTSVSTSKKKTKTSKSPAAAASKTGTTKTSTKKTTKKSSTAGSKKSRSRSSGKTRDSTNSKAKARTVAEAASLGDADAQGYVFINGRRVRMISTKGQELVRTKKKTRTDASPAETVAETPKQVKTKLSRKELTFFQDLLLERRRELVGNLDSMEEEALRSNGGNLSHMPIHMADVGSDTYEQDFMLGLAESERKMLREIDGALQRIVDGTYGMCLKTGKPIPKARLNAKPWAKYTIEAAREMEREQYS